MSSRRRTLTRVRIVWSGAGLALLAALVLAPVFTVTAYYDAADPAVSYQETKSLSPIGLEANLWLWIAVSAVILVSTVRGYRRSEPYRTIRAHPS